MKRVVRKRVSSQGDLFPWKPETMKYDALVGRVINTFFKHPTVVAAITSGKTVDICPVHRCVLIGQYKEEGKAKRFWITEVWGHSTNARNCCYSAAGTCWPFLSRAELADILDGRDGITRLSKPDAVKRSNPEFYMIALYVLNNNPYVVRNPRMLT